MCCHMLTLVGESLSFPTRLRNFTPVCNAKHVSNRCLWCYICLRACYASTCSANEGVVMVLAHIYSTQTISVSETKFVSPRQTHPVLQ